MEIEGWGENKHEDYRKKNIYPVKDTSEMTLFLKIMSKVLSGKSGKIFH